MMPGAFLQDDAGPSRRVLGSQSSTTSMQLPSDLLDQNLLQSFEKKQKSISNILLQSHLITQLDNLVYILVGYQMVKYCHSASMLPALGHILVENFLSCKAITSKQAGFISFVSEVSRAEQNDQYELTVKGAVATACSGVYWKTVIVILYHIMFMSFWLIPIVDQGGLKMISNGTWWFVSFIGEYRPIENWQELSYIQKVTKLGLWELIACDLVILFIQLVLFQSIFRQSTLLPYEDVGDEAQILRRQGEAVEATGDVVLRVRLYEVFSSDSFIGARS